MQKDTKSLIWGIILIAIGFLFLGQNLNWFNIRWDHLWPLLLMGGGLLFWIGWLAKRREIGLLMPGTILLTYGALFLYCENNGWFWMETLWPVFLLGPGLGFLFMYLLGQREAGLLLPAGILIVLSFLFWAGEGAFTYFWPALLIVIGLYLLFKARNRKSPARKSTEVTAGENRE